MERKARKNHRKSDGSYRRLFSHPRMVEDLLRKFVAQPWIEKLHFETLELMPAHYTSPTLEQRESDLVWRLKYGENPEDWFFVYILLELQSSIFPFMAIRILAYLALFYQFLIQQKLFTKAGKLPPVLPIVLYNGSSPWSAATEVADLIEPIEGGLEDFIPQFRYLVLDETHYPLADLEPIDNPVAAVFKLEQSQDLGEIERTIDILLDILDDQELKDLREDFTLWLRMVLLQSRFEGDRRQEVLGKDDLRELKDMLEQRVREWPKQWMAEGFREGRQSGLEEGRRSGLEEGLDKGLRRGEAQLLSLQLEEKFGPLGQHSRERLESASTTQLARWAKRVLTAATLDEVFVEG